MVIIASMGTTEYAINVTKWATLLASAQNLILLVIMEREAKMLVQLPNATSVTGLATLLEIVAKKRRDVTDVTALATLLEIVRNNRILATTVTKSVILSRTVLALELRIVISVAGLDISAESADLNRTRLLLIGECMKF